MKVARIAAAAALTLLALAGCAPDSPEPSGSDAPTPNPSTTPTTAPAANPVMPEFTDDQVVLTVSADATAPNGAVLSVTMTTYYPVTADSPEAAQIQEYLAFVGNTSDVADPSFTAANGAVIQVSRLTATAVSGVWPAGSGVLPSLGPGRTDTIIDIPAGPIVGSRLSLTGAGNGFGVAAIYSQDGTPTDPASWANRFTYYGFNDAYAGTTLSNCAVAYTPLGSASPGVGGWGGHNCFVGLGD